MRLPQPGSYMYIHVAANSKQATAFLGFSLITGEVTLSFRVAAGAAPAIMPECLENEEKKKSFFFFVWRFLFFF